MELIKKEFKLNNYSTNLLSEFQKLHLNFKIKI